MGRSDAKARRDELLEFFGDPSDDERQEDVITNRDPTPSISPPGT